MKIKAYFHCQNDMTILCFEKKICKEKLHRDNKKITKLI